MPPHLAQNPGVYVDATSPSHSHREAIGPSPPRLQPPHQFVLPNPLLPGVAGRRETILQITPPTLLTPTRLPLSAQL